MRLGALFDNVLLVCGTSLNVVERRGDWMLSEIFPNSPAAELAEYDAEWPTDAELLVAEWERQYDLPAYTAGTGNLPARRLEIIAKVRAVGGMSKPYFENIAAGLDYNIGGSTDPHLRIVDGEFLSFRADYGRVDVMRLDDGRLAVSELELIEPGLYLDVAPASAGPFADLVRSRIG